MVAAFNSNPQIQAKVLQHSLKTLLIDIHQGKTTSTRSTTIYMEEEKARVCERELGPTLAVPSFQPQGLSTIDLIDPKSNH